MVAGSDLSRPKEDVKRANPSDGARKTELPPQDAALGVGRSNHQLILTVEKGESAVS